MSNTINSNKSFSYNLSDEYQLDKIFTVSRALANKDRLELLRLLESKPMTITEIAKEMNIPKSTAAMHADILRDAQLIFINYKPGKKGHIKLCSRSANFVEFIFDNKDPSNFQNIFQFEMPIGNYFDFQITPPCGLVDAEKEIGKYDDVETFLSPERFKAELLWFQSGYVSYKFPNLPNRQLEYESISFSLEFCSETIYSRNDWPSDITIWINDIEVITHTSPGDFGGRRGKYTPEYWFINSTQYGILNEFTVNENGCYTNRVLTHNKITINQLNLGESPFIKFKIGVKEDAFHKGGINIFGKNFGDYNQAIILKIKHK